MVQVLKYLLVATGILFSSYVQSKNIKTKPTEQKVVIGYILLSDNLANKLLPLLEWKYLTHINASFAKVKADGTLNTTDIQKEIKKVRKTAHRHGVKVLISIARNTKGEFSAAIANPESRKKAAKEIINFVRDNKLDGFDIDYEEHDNTSDNESFRSLLAFVKELYTNKDKEMLMTCAVYGRWLYYGTEWSQYFNYINVMSYDGKSVFSATQPVQHASFEDFEKDLANWSEKLKTPKNKIIGGLPFYGFIWDKTEKKKGESIRYNDILTQWGNQAADKDELEARIYYNGRHTIQQKCHYIKENNYGGVMIWQLFQDTFNDNPNLSLIRVIGETMLHHK